MRLSRGAASLISVLALALILIGVNAMADTWLGGAQLDLTQERLYTLAPGTRQILSELREPITLRLFYSRQIGANLPVYGAYADRVRDLLRQYVAASHGKVRLELYDPEPFTDVEDQAIAAGLQGVPIDRNGAQVFFGLVGNDLLDDQRTIPFFQPERERFLEFDISRMVHDLSNPKRPVLGIMSSLPLQGDPQRTLRGLPGGAPYVSVLQLRDAFAIRDVPTDALAIDPDVQVLLVAQAQNLSPATLYAIDQFVMRGGHLLAMVDPHSEAEAAQPDPAGSGLGRADTSSNLTPLFDAWGVTFDPDLVVGDLDGAWRVRTGPAERVTAVDYVPWFNIRDGINHDDPATADIEQVTVAAPGFLAKKPGAAIAFTPLLTSGPRSGLIPANAVRVQPDPVRILDDFHPEGGGRVIAARVRGVLSSAFAGPPDPPPGRHRPAGFPPHLAHTATLADMVLVADTDILDDRFWVRIQDFFGQPEARPFSDNGAFLVNVAGTLAGGDALLGLRGRGGALRPFDRIDAMQRDAEARFRQTEQQLQAHLTETDKKLTELRAGGAGGDSTDTSGRAVLTEEQRHAIDDLTRDVALTRGRLRRVQLDLRREIDALETELRLLDVAAVPAALTLLAIGIGIARRRRAPS